jgi:hypothetical protein
MSTQSGPPVLRHLQVRLAWLSYRTTLPIRRPAMPPIIRTSTTAGVHPVAVAETAHFAHQPTQATQRLDARPTPVADQRRRIPRGLKPLIWDDRWDALPQDVRNQINRNGTVINALARSSNRHWQISQLMGLAGLAGTAGIRQREAGVLRELIAQYPGVGFSVTSTRRPPVYIYSPAIQGGSDAQGRGLSTD